MLQNTDSASVVPPSLLVHRVPAARTRSAPPAAAPTVTTGRVLLSTVKLAAWLLVAASLSLLSPAELQLAGKLVLCGISSAIALYASLWLLLLFGANRIRWTGR